MLIGRNILGIPGMNGNMAQTNKLKYTDERKRNQIESEQMNSCAVINKQCTALIFNGKEGMKL